MLYKILKYPTPENVNPSLFKAVKDEILSMGVGLPPDFPYPCQGAYKTWHFITHNRDKIEGADTLLTWIEKQLPQVAYDFADSLDKKSANSYVISIIRGSAEHSLAHIQDSSWCSADQPIVS